MAMSTCALGSALLIGAAMLGGCTLGSEAPFLTQGDNVPGLLDGKYQRYVITDPVQLRSVPAGIRKDCIAPGYVFRLPNKKGRARNLVISPSYCPYDGERRVPAMDLAREGDGYRLSQPGKTVRIRFQRLRDGIYLIQSDDPESEGLRYGYALSREAPGGIDLALLFCDYFPALKSIHEVVADNVTGDAVETPAAPDPEPTPPPDPVANAAPNDLMASEGGDCRAPSLEAIRPQLDLVVDRFARGREPVWVLLRRVPGG
jgi:hypothetical protein